MFSTDVFGFFEYFTSKVGYIFGCGTHKDERVTIV